MENELCTHLVLGATPPHYCRCLPALRRLFEGEIMAQKQSRSPLLPGTFQVEVEELPLFLERQHRVRRVFSQNSASRESVYRSRDVRKAFSQSHFPCLLFRPLSTLCANQWSVNFQEMCNYYVHIECMLQCRSVSPT